MQNNGNCPATGVTVSDTIDTGVLGPPYVFTPASGMYDAPSDTYTWPPTSVAGSGAEVFTYKVSGTIRPATEGFAVCNSAVVAYDQGPPVTSNPAGGTCASVPIQPPRCTAAALGVPADLAAVKTNFGADIAFTWSATGAPEQHLNVVTVKNQNHSAKRAPWASAPPYAAERRPACTLVGAVQADVAGVLPGVRSLRRDRRFRQDRTDKASQKPRRPRDEGPEDSEVPKFVVR